MDRTKELELPLSSPGERLPSARPQRSNWLFALTIFVSAFLLFLVQPLIARIILPWFGGTAAVWTTCMMFFQTALLLGYLYSFWSVGSLRPKLQAAVHLGLLAASLLVLPILPSAAWKPTGAEQPILRIVILLAATVGIPYLVLSTTGPLLQAWYSRLNSSKLPYRLYALSNAGSLLALISYPVVVEPLLNATTQAYGWSWVYGGFVLLCGAVAALVLASAPRASAIQTPAQPELEPSAKPRWTELLLWIALAAVPSALLLAITNHLSQNIAPIPLLWVVPLALYLLSLILCFDSDRWYNRDLWFPLLLIGVGAMSYYLFPDRANENISRVVPVFVLGLFFCCMACHGELAKRKPAPRYLTIFFLMLSVGGALGGMFVALLSPFIFTTYIELPIALLACAVLISAVLYRDRFLNLVKWLPRVQLGVAVGVAVSLIFLLTIGEHNWESEQRLLTRNFYGALRVADEREAGQDVRHLFHGTINHGSQILNPAGRRKPISYYCFTSGVGRAAVDKQARGPMKLGVIGLGAGTMAAYGRPGDTVVFYEINPLVQLIARSQFTYLSGSKSKLDVVMGDARRSLEAQPPQQFDLLAVDAFSSDAIPVHLLTTQAFQEYFRHLKPDGVLAVHISNRYLQLEWVVRLAAQALGKTVLGVFDEAGDDDPILSSSDWMLISSSPTAFTDPKWQKLGEPGKRPPGLKLWTDEYSNLLSILK